MALYSIVDLSGSDGQQNFAFNIPYLAQAHIYVFIDAVVLVAGTAYTFLTASTIRLNTALAGPHTVRIQRVTPINLPVVDYANGSVLGESDLDASSLQLLYIAQETVDGSTTGLTTGVSFQWDALGKQIINVADPTLATDAATKGYADSVSGGAAQAAAVAAAEAQAAIALQIKNDIIALPLVNVSAYIQSLFDDLESATARQTLQIPTASEVWSNKNFSGAIATANPVLPLGLSTKQYTDSMSFLGGMLF
jgi:hypothetical protein